MTLVRFLSYPVYFNPASKRSSTYVMEHFYAIRSNTRLRQFLKHLGRPVIPLLRGHCRLFLGETPGYERLRPYLARKTIEVVVDARRFWRLIDFQSRTVTSVLKNEDDRKYFENEIGARRRLAGADFLPALLDVEREEGIFREEYVCESPFKSATLRDLDRKKFIDRILEILGSVHQSILSSPPRPEDYLQRMVSEISARPEAGRRIIDYVQHLRENACDPEVINPVFSHGDFRKDPIFFAPAGEIKVIDWECSGIFSRDFDILGLYLTEKWLYGSPDISLTERLGLSPREMKERAYLYLLELTHFPIRFRREFSLRRSIPIIRGVEERINKTVLQGEGS